MRAILELLVFLLYNPLFIVAFGSPITSVTQERSSSARLISPVSPKQAQGQDVMDAPDHSLKPVLSFPGGGIFFWAGAITALQERYALGTLDSVGASAGALAATLAACEVDMDKAMDIALDLCEANQVWSRPLGLAGVWGDMVEEWLDDLLPPDADAICRYRVHLLVLGIWPRPGRRRTISDFASKEDLIQTCLASVHIPLFMNKKFTARHRGGRFIDGSFRAGREAMSLGEQRPTVFLDFMEDEVMAQRRRKFLGLTNRDGLLFMQERGYEHIQRLLVEGKLDCLESAALLPSRPELASRPTTGGG